MYKMIRLLLLTLSFTLAQAASLHIEINSNVSKWLNHAKQIELSLNTSVNPCEDFFEFACGEWKKNNPIPFNKKYWSPESLHRKYVKESLIGILQTPDKSTDSLAYKSLKKVYRNCMDERQREAVDLDSLLELLDKIGGWPLTTPIDSKKRVTSKILNNIVSHAKNLFGIGVFYDVKVESYLWTDSTYSLFLERTKTPLERILVTRERNSSEVNSYARYIEEVVKLAANAKGILLNETNVHKDVHDMIDFQIKLIKIWMEVERADMDNKTIREFQLWYDALDPGSNAYASWLNFFKVLFNPVGISIKHETNVIIDNLGFAERLIRLLDKTPLRTIHNFAIWNIIYHFLKYLPETMINIRHELDNIGRTVPTILADRGSRCMQELPFEHALMAEFVRKHLEIPTKDLAVDIISKVSKSAKEFIGSTSWMSPNQSNIARGEIEKLNWNIGYPNWYDEASAIDKYYGNPRYAVGRYLNNRLQIIKFETKNEYTRLNKKNDESRRFTDRASDIVAQYRVDMSITITAAFLLQRNSYSTYPMAINYGSFGSVVGHEISHVFDLFNVHLNDDISSSWSKENYDELDSRAECLQEQYDKYIVYKSPDSTIMGDGGKSIREDMADFLGTKIAFLAYEKNKKLKDVNARLPRLIKYNDRQLFFLSFANNFCSAETLQYYQEMQKHKSFSYSFNKLRVNGVVSNMKEFSDAFSCPLNSPMNPKDKCQLYGPSD